MHAHVYIYIYVNRKIYIYIEILKYEFMYLKILFGLLDGWVVTYLPPYSNLHLPSRKFPFFHGKPVLARVPASYCASHLS